MRTERTFLMELFLDDDLPKPIKIKIKERFEEMETPHSCAQQTLDTLFPDKRPVVTDQSHQNMAAQSPSMQRIMAANPDLVPQPAPPVTPAAAQALAARQALINSAGKEKPENGRKAPRKI